MFVYGRPHPDGSEETPLMSTINFDDFLGRMFLLPLDENGERKRATISDHVHTLDQAQGSRVDKLRFKLTEFRQLIQVQSHLEMSGILVQLGHIQRT